MEGEWSCFRGGHFNGGRMVMLQKWSLYWREYVMDVVSFMEREWPFHRGAHFNVHMSIVVLCFLYTVYLTFKSPYLPLPLLQCFPPHSKLFPYRGAREIYACKNRASMSKPRRVMTF